MDKTKEELIEYLKSIEQMVSYATLIVWLFALMVTLIIYFS